MIEAAALTGLGGMIDVILGAGVAVGGGIVLPMFVPSFPTPVLTLTPGLVAFAVSLAIGLIAGVYPAHRAAGMRPIEALRFE